MRPNSGDKTFTGRVVEEDKFEDFIEMEKDCYNVDDNEMVLLGEAYKLSAEWRFIVCKDRVITGSKYKSKDHIL